MKRLTCPCFLILLLLTCGLKCNTDVARVMLPELIETDETDADADMALALEMEAILQSEGEVLSPIPDDVYQLLWGHWTKAGSLAPRDYYTKYIDAGGIAIVGGDLTEDALFQAARHLVLIMTAKLPGLRDALSITTPGPGNLRFRLVLYDAFAYVTADLPELQGVQGAEFIGGHYDWPRAVAGVRSIKHGPSGTILIHEMAHAIHHALVRHPHLLPGFNERLINEYERQLEHFHLREAKGLPLESDFGEPYPVCGGKNDYQFVNVDEFWAHFVQNHWFDEMYEIWAIESPDYHERLKGHRTRCGDIVILAEEVFLPVSLTDMMIQTYWETED